VVALTQSYVPLLHLGRCREIEHRLTHAVETHPDDVRALSLLARQRAATFRVRGAEGAHTRQLIARALRLSPDAAEPTEALARFHLSRGEWVLALTETRQFVESHPGHRDGWLCHAEVAFHTGDWQLAADSLLAALRLEPGDIRAYSSAVEILGTAGRLKDLAWAMDEMMRRFPKHWTAQSAACSAMLLHGGAGSEALELSGRMLALQPQIPQVWFQRAGCLSQAGRPHAALEAIREGQRQIPEAGAEWYGALAALSAASLSRALGEETRGWLWQAVTEAREGAKAWNTVLGLDMEGRVWEALGDRKRALQAYRRAQTMYPGYLLGAVLSHKIGRLGASR
jgi:tetratricopeptide (TPR) repeat protein